VISPLKKLSFKTYWVAFHDYAVTFLALLLAVSLRGDPYISEFGRQTEIVAGLTFSAAAIVVYYSCSLYASRWRFASLFDLFGIFKAVSILTATLLIADYIVSPRVIDAGKYFGGRTLAIYWCVQIILLGGPRVAYRAFRSWRRSSAHGADLLAAIAIGRAADAEGVIRLAEAGLAGPIRIYGIVTTVPHEVRQVVRGVPVWGSIDAIEAIVREANERGVTIQRALIAPEALKESREIEEVVGLFRRLGIPAIRLDIAHSTDMVRPAKLHAVIDEDLLIRPLVEVDEEPLKAFVQGKRVVVTGGGGSIGSELVLRSAEIGAARVLVIDSSEAALHAVLERAELTLEDDKASVVEGRLCDIRDRARIAELIKTFAPDVVFHAAALKHVPHLEREVAEAVRTNVLGTVNTADAAIAAGVGVFVLISTDKATRPVSILGATKRIAELYTQSIDAAPALVGGDVPRATRLVAVRFGNVLGTAGSVVPRFRAQIEAGGPVTVTDPGMVRYFMTKHEATDLLWTAARVVATQGPGCQSAVLVLNMGQPVRIDDLARRMIRLAGFEPERSMPMVYTGKRPGERMTEYLFEEREPQFDIGVRGIVAAESQVIPLPRLHAAVANLADAAERGDDEAVRDLVAELVPDIRKPKNVVSMDQARGQLV
jgi:FlaA1/EpsC-like NDP-sugar epimerase